VVTRVEWTRLDGGDVEAVVAMFVNRKHVNSVRITPSKGDGGVDILDRKQGPGGGDPVYQVKRYAEPLSARQKAEVEKSLQALTHDPRWSGLNVTVW
jgi:HJR/Mrr/RecB family endonuclease